MFTCLWVEIMDYNLVTMLIILLHIILFIAFDVALRIIVHKNKKWLSGRFSLQISKVVVIVSLIIICLLRFKVIENISGALIASSSLLVAVLGFAAQESLNNVLSGIMIAKSKPFDIGQRVVIEEKHITGIIVDISLRHTVIQKFNNATVIVPNSVMNTVVIENSSYNENMIANFLDISVAYESDIDKAIDIVEDVVTSHALFLHGYDPCVLVRNLAMNGFSVRATVWTKTISENFKACSDIRIEIKKRFDAVGIEIPYEHVKVID